MEKNNLIILGLLGALGAGAYLYLSNQDQSIGGGGAGSGSNKGSDYFFNIAAPVFPDLSSFFTDTSAPTTETAAKKDTPIIINQADYKPGSVVIVPIKSTIPSTTGGQNFPTVIPINTSYKPPMAAPAAQPPLQIQNILGFPVVPHLATSSPTVTSKKTVPIVIPKAGNKAALITTGTPENQIALWNTAPKIYQGKKVM